MRYCVYEFSVRGLTASNRSMIDGYRFMFVGGENEPLGNIYES